MRSVWEITINNEKYKMNFDSYTSIYNVQDTREEEILLNIHEFFQPRKSKENEVLIYDSLNDISLNNKTYQSFYWDNNTLLEEFKLASSSTMNKALQRNLSEDVDIGMYLNTINSLLDESIGNIQESTPIKVEHVNFKKLLKMIYFDLNESDQFKGYYEKLKLVLLMMIEEVKKSAKSTPLIILNHPESYLSPKEQKMFREVLNQLDVTIIVLTESIYFLSDSLEGLNHYSRMRLILDRNFIEDLYWSAPMEFDEDLINQSLLNIIKLYISKFEVSPVITNYKLSDIILFEPVDIYVCLRYLKHCNYDFEIDFNYTKIPKPLKEYIYHL